MREFSKHFLPLLISSFIVSTLTAGDVDFVWKQRSGTEQVVHSKTPMDDIQKEVSKSVSAYFEPRKVIDIQALYPPEVPKPKEPMAVKKPVLAESLIYTQGKYEPKDVYVKRVNEAKAKQEAELEAKKERYLAAVNRRNAYIDKKAIEYKENVKQRNEILRELQAKIDEDYDKIKREQKEKEIKVERYLSVFFKNAFKKYFQNPRIESSDYYVNDEMMQIVLGSTANDFKQSFEFKIKPHEAQKMDQSLSKIKPLVHYKIKNDPESQSISINLDHVVLKFDGEEYIAKVGKQERQNNFVTTRLNIANPEEIPVSQQKLVLQDDSIEIHKQDMTYEDKTFAVKTDEENDILRRLGDMKEVKEDKSKWLIVIGIERYESTDSIFYSKKSAETYTKVTQKLLGISQGHTLQLIDEEATFAKLKGQLKNMLARVKKGDTLYFYYSGHGIPVPTEKNEPYMLAQDVAAEDVQDYKFLKLKNIYKMLSDTKAKKVIAIVDSCFSGSTDGKSNIKGVAATALVAKKVDGYDKRKMVIIAAGKDTQYSNKYDEKQHRLFSYFVMDALLKNDRKVEEVYKYSAYNVEETSQDLKMKKQTPVVMGAKGLTF